MIKRLLKLGLFIGFIWLFLHMNNQWLQTSSLTVSSDRIPSAFDGLKIVHLSDLHDATFGENQTRLANKVKQLEPDLIFLTGDIIDSNRYDLHNSVELVEQLVTFSNVFYVIGNHEVAINEVDEITDTLSSLGVTVLMNEHAMIERNGERMVIAGVEDPLNEPYMESELAVKGFIENTVEELDPSLYTLLLSHRPEVFDIYVEEKIDVVFTGHAHGGQVRLPGFGGLIAPGQGWFPAYTAGTHESGMTTMIVSRGLGNSIFPFRIWNRPEIIFVTLEKR